MKRSEEMATALEAAEAEEDREALDEVYVRPGVPHRPSQVYSVRIPVERIEELRRVARREGVGPTTLMRKWVVERLDVERPMKTSHDIVIALRVSPDRMRDGFERPGQLVFGVSA